VTISEPFEDVWRREVPHVLGALVRRYGDFAACEDAVQEALLAASQQWQPGAGPDSPRGWLLRVASRRLIDAHRSESARTAREMRAAIRDRVDTEHAPAADQQMPGSLAEGAGSSPDDPRAGTGSEGHDPETLHLLLLCAHPALTPAAQAALTLRAIGGLTTDQIASAFLVPSATMGQRISRAKATLAAAGARFAAPTASDLPDRLTAVGQVLYLIFNEGYTASGGERLMDIALSAEAIRLTRELRAAVPDHAETAGLLALMLLTQSRAAARVDAGGDLVPLEHQDRSLWDRTMIAEATSILEVVLPHATVGPYQLQAAIAAVHAEAPTWADTDWLQIAILYRMLDGIAPGPTVRLNLAVAVGMAYGPAAGLEMLEPLREDPALRRGHRIHAVRAHLLEMVGERGQAIEEYLTAARMSTSVPEQRYLNARAGRLA
jgi:RNA polymerase sigma factor (sigma-70 family)